ncbi:LOW QUALITY PROTEIN: uncharacterized protein [Panulirus ornatus]|uniref:LOW QUALITY PROTEIN: uncharacterized protein n=1 Tax=Panulirus ornatus TaxID=150431 RepID=UPI003A87263D
MRARSVQLVTSWWVVGVWAALGIATGVISVVTVLQPAWYVRYTVIHAQEARGVAFQVVVSSVGPLGYCRLAAVDTSKVTHTRTRGHHVFSRPSSTEASADPDEGVTSVPPLPSTSVAPAPVEASSDLDLLSSTASPESFQTTKTPNDSLQEWPPSGAHYTTLSSGNVLSHTPLAGPADGDEAEDAGEDEKTPFEGFEAPSNTDKDVTDETHDTEDILFQVTETDLQVAKEEGEGGSVALPPKGKIEFVASGGATGTQEISEHETAITEERNTTRHKQSGADAGQEVDNGKEFIVANTMSGGREIAESKKTPAGKSRKRKNRKRKRKKKKRYRKRPKSRKEKVNVQTRIPKDRDVNRQSDGTPSGLIHLSHLVTSGQDHPANSSHEEEVVAQFLKRTEDREDYYENIAVDYYYPRAPILLCSGLGVGSGSSAVWVLVGVVYGVAGVVQTVAGVASLALNFTHAHARRYTLAIWVGNVQVAVVMSQSVALVLFPLGLGSPLARVECGGSSSVYWPGECSFGWSYMLGVVVTSLAAYCPCLARLTVFRRYVLREWESLNFF